MSASQESGRPPVVDVHCHVSLPDLESSLGGRFRPEYDPFSYHAGAVSNRYNADHFPEIVPQLTEPSRRLEDMDRMGWTSRHCRWRHRSTTTGPNPTWGSG
ncbi:MAG: hypothetical protein M3445_09095 [Actinomycetota bacterium]|nr:hypothetical protein [Actinomycetota bacterium]